MITYQVWVSGCGITYIDANNRHDAAEEYRRHYIPRRNERDKKIFVRRDEAGANTGVFMLVMRLITTHVDDIDHRDNPKGNYD